MMATAIKRWLGLTADDPPEPADQYNPAHEPPPLGDVLQRGLAAQRILGDPTLAEAFQALRKDNYNAWLASESSIECELLHREARALDAVAAKLKGYIGAAKLRAAQDAASDA